MVSTYTPALRIEEMATGDQSGTWGDTTNNNFLLFEQAITGVLSVAEGDTTLTLTALDGASDQSRNAVVILTGAMTAGRNVVVPTSNKLYLIKNSTSNGFAVTVKTAAGTGVAVPAGTARWVYCDGTNVVDGLGQAWSTTSSAFRPDASDGLALGTSALMWSDLFLASGGVVNWNAGNYTLTHSAGLLTANGTLAITAASAGFTALQAISTEAGAAAGPIVELYRNSASPANSDILGQVIFYGTDSGAAKQEYASIEAVISDVTAASEDASLDFYTPVAGARTKMISLGPNLGLPIGQIAFPATQNPSSNANTLDDYEEGTFTPTVAFGGASVGVTYSTQIGTYTKIGNCVLFEIVIVLSNNGSSSGAASVSLPFTAAGLGAAAIEVTSLALAVDGQVTAVFSSATILLRYRDNGSSSITNLTETQIGDTTTIIIGGNFRV